MTHGNSVKPIVASDLSVQHIESVASSIFSEFRGVRRLEELLDGHYTFDAVYGTIIRPKYQIQLVEHADLGFVSEAKILGRYLPASNTAEIDLVVSREANSPMRTFVLWHEVVGHGVLQGDSLRRQIAGGSVDIEPDTELTLSDWERQRLEIQANRCAAATAAPLDLVDAALKKTYGQDLRKLCYTGPREYSVQFHRFRPDTFNDFCRELARPLQHHFDGLSMQALSYRIERSKIGRLLNCGPDRKMKLFRAVDRHRGLPGSRA